MLKTEPFTQFKEDHPNLWNAGLTLGAGALSFAGTIAILFLANSAAGVSIQSGLASLFALNTVQTMWYVTRSAGLAAYLLLWFSVVLGLAIPTRILDRLLPRAATYDFHQFISLLAIGFTALHGAVLLIDGYLPFSIAQILVPFISPFRPLWVGIGVFSFYLMLLVTITTYLKSRIGLKAFKVIHMFSLVAFLGVAIHSYFSGTDSSLPVVQWMYALTTLSVLAFTGYWVFKGTGVGITKRVPGKRSQILN